MNTYFEKRFDCPCCHEAKGVELCRVPYADQALGEYLVSFYGPQGGVEFEYLSEQDYVLVECVGCGLVYQEEIPNEFLMRKLYEEWIDPSKVFENKERGRKSEFFSHLRTEIEGILDLLDRPSVDVHLLDYSMGWGHWCRIAQEFGCKVHGTEFSRARVNYAKQGGVDVITHDEVAFHAYDFINTEQVFEHLPDPRSVLAYLKKSLKPHGIIKICVPDTFGVKAGLEAWDWMAPKGSPLSLNPVAPLEHVNGFNRRSLLALAEAEDLFPVGRRTRAGGFKERVKALLRPIWTRYRAVSAQAIARRGGTYQLFQAK